MADGQLRVKMQWMTGWWPGVAVRRRTRALNVLLKFIWLGNIQTPYLAHSLCSTGMATLQVLKSQKDGLSSLSQRESLHEVRDSVNDEKVADKAARECSETAKHAKRLQKSQFFKLLHGLLWNYTLHALQKDKLFHYSAAQQLWITAPALTLVLPTLGY